MNVSMLLPSALVALLALAVPLLLHLVRRNQQTRVEFAALRWLGQRVQPRHRPRFNEWLLLALRLLLLALAALWLAQPVLRGAPDLRPWLLVHPAIDPARAPPAADPGEHRRWLAPGFPPLEAPAPAAGASIGSLLREADALLAPAVAVRVVVPERFDATDPQRPLLGRNVQWIAVPGTHAIARRPPPPPLQLALQVDADHRSVLPYLRAAAAALTRPDAQGARALRLRELPEAGQLAARDTHLAWLSTQPPADAVRAWVRRGGVALLAQDAPSSPIAWHDAQVAWRDDQGAVLAIATADGNGRWIRLLVPMEPESMPLLLDPTFPSALHAVLAGQGEPTRVHASAYAPTRGAARASEPPPQPLGPWLALLIGLVFAVERWLAAAPRRLGMG